LPSFLVAVTPKEISLMSKSLSGRAACSTNPGVAYLRPRAARRNCDLFCSLLRGTTNSLTRYGQSGACPPLDERRNLSAEAFTTLGATTGQDFQSTHGGFTCAKAMATLTNKSARLKCTFHGLYSIICQTRQLCPIWWQAIGLKPKNPLSTVIKFECGCIGLPMFEVNACKQISHPNFALRSGPTGAILITCPHNEVRGPILSPNQCYLCLIWHPGGCEIC
jgi:hypothetical protein